MISYCPDFYFHDNHCWLNPGNIFLYKKIEVYFNMLEVKKTDFPKILSLISEPRYIRPLAENSEVIKNKNKFNLILTHDDEILQNCENAIFMPLGTTWIGKEDQNGDNEKQFGVSFLCGGKKFLEGHLLRHNIWYKQKEIKMPIDFWNSYSNPVSNINNNKQLGWEPWAKIKLMKSQYHICVENCKLNGYFSEKIMDCLITKTIPIYWGCLDIQKFFNIKGMFIFNNEFDLIDILNKKINENTYANMKKYVDENYEKAKEYCIGLDKRIENILNLHKEKW